MADLTGQQFGNYHLLGLLGQGGFADVYLGRHLYLQTQAALKIHRSRVDGYTLEQFRTEAQAIAHLVHPHIVRLLDFGVENGIAYFVMDYAPLGSLRHLHPKGTQLPLTTIVPYVRQVAAALQFVHDQKLIHRDMKPENMLAGQSCEILLSDFGLVLPAQSTESLSTKEMAGTVAYMAPEQIQGKSRPASDQYALGIVIYEWLSGEQPFRGSAFEIYGQHLHVPPPSLCEKLPSLSPAIERVIVRALAKEPRHRFTSIEAFATAFEQACLPTSHHVLAPATVSSPLVDQAVPSVEIATPPNGFSQGDSLLVSTELATSQSSQSSQPNSLAKRKGTSQQSSLQGNQQMSHSS